MGVLKVQYLPQYTIEDYMSWEGDWELIHGIPYSMSPSPTSGHQRTGLSVMQVLKEALSTSSCHCEIFYELDWHLKEDTVVGPDILVLCGEELKDDFVTQVPSLIIEILSPTTAEKDRTLKAELYANTGVHNYILIDYLRKKIEVFTLMQGKYQIHVSPIMHLGDCEISPDWTKVFMQ
jgi:Uma2 family endonuclease